MMCLSSMRNAQQKIVPFTICVIYCTCQVSVQFKFTASEGFQPLPFGDYSNQAEIIVGSFHFRQPP